jgi:hypothetical protein
VAGRTVLAISTRRGREEESGNVGCRGLVMKKRVVGAVGCSREMKISLL